MTAASYGKFRPNRLRDERIVRTGFWGKLQRFLALLPFAEDLIAAYYAAFDRETPAHVKAMLFAALAYFVIPIDGIPDLLPVLGFTDDAALLAAVLRYVSSYVKPRHRTRAEETMESLKAKVASSTKKRR